MAYVGRGCLEDSWALEGEGVPRREERGLKGRGVHRGWTGPWWEEGTREMRGPPEGSGGGLEGGSNQRVKRDPRGQRAWPGELRGPWREERFLEGRGRPQRVEEDPEGAPQGAGDFRVRKAWPWVSGGS